MCALKTGQTFVELGCGNARVSKYIATQNPDVEVIGIELAFPIYLIAKLRSLFGPSNLEIKFGDALKYDISDADLIYVFGLIETMNEQVKAKALREMKPGTKLISYVFSIKNWPGRSTSSKAQDGGHNIHVYTK